MIITIGGEKGGVGKSTVATNVSVALAQAGKDVLLVNTDAQDTVGSWASVRAEEHADKAVVHTTSLHGNSVAKGLIDFSKRYEVVVVDAAGNDSVEQRQAMAVSNALIIPMRPTAFDVWTLDTVENLVGQAQAMNPDLAVGVFLNQVLHISLDRGQKDMKELMVNYPTINFMNSSLTTLASFQKAAGEGLGVTELERPGKAKSQILGLVDEIYAICKQAEGLQNVA